MLTTMLRRDTRRERTLRTLGGALVLIGGGAMLGALMIGPWQIHSLDDALAANLPQRMVVGFAGIVVAIVGWVLRGAEKRA